MKHKIKKSEMKKKLHYADVDGALELMEWLGVEWEPEEDWLKLGIYPVEKGYALGLAASDIRFSGIPLSLRQANVVVECWNARRPGGPMEKLIRQVINECGLGTMGRETLEKALKLGIEPDYICVSP